MTGSVVSIPVDRIHLFDKNPRHGFIADPDKIIERLLKEEQVYELAKSIARSGLNPLQVIGVIRVDDPDDAGEPTYVVWEGNRRVCATMLLNDPDLAPPIWRKRFEALAAETDHIDELEARVFEDKAVLQFWMRNIHNGAQKGRGRKDWGPDEQHRDNPTKKNAIAFEILERAESEGWIAAADRKSKLTTLQRFVGQNSLREILKADDSNLRRVRFGRSATDLSKLIRQLICDLLDETGEFAITSRKNEAQIEAYAAALEARAGVVTLEDDEVADSGDGRRAPSPGMAAPDGDTTDAHPDASPDDDEEETPFVRPRPPRTIKSDKDLSRAISSSGNDKLIDLYSSLTKIRADSHPQLIAVGCWSLIETIAAVCGASEGQAFTAFFNTGMMGNQFGIPKPEARTIYGALNRFALAGNDTKHHAISGAFNGMQLINDMEVVSPLLAKALEKNT